MKGLASRTRKMHLPFNFVLITNDVFDFAHRLLHGLKDRSVPKIVAHEGAHEWQGTGEKQSSRPVLKLITPTLRFCLTLGSLEGAVELG